MTTKAQRLSKIEFYDLGERIIKMLFGDEPISAYKVSKILKEEGYDISPASIYAFREMTIRTSKELLLKKPQYREKLAETFLDTVENLAYALAEIKAKIEEFKDRKDWKAQATFLGLLLQELNLLLKRAGEIRPTQIIKEVNIIQINQAIQLQIAELIDKGDIPLKHCSEKIKKFYKNAKKIRA